MQKRNFFVIAITGTPGTGKTTLSKELAAALDFYYVDANKIIESNNLAEIYDEKRDSYVVDENKLSEALEKNISFLKNNKEGKKGAVIDSHMSHFLQAKTVDICIVAKCDISVLKTRLEQRGYSQKKVRENLDSEILDVCLVEAVENKHNVEVIDLTYGVDKDFIVRISQMIKK